MSKTAALLCVRNKASRLKWWIAHHLSLGFSPLLICDDHSTDGTDALLAQAACLHDIRISQTDGTIDNRNERHSKALLGMIRQIRQECDWAVILAADEFVHLEQAASITELAASQSARDHFSVNWCLYGTNGRTDQEARVSGLSPFELYPRHAPEEFPDHRVVRHFFRPAAIDGTLPDPLAHVKQAPDWSEARILHYAATSSMGTERQYFDRNDVKGPGTETWLHRSRPIAAALLQTGLAALHRQLYRHPLKPTSPAGAKDGEHASALSLHGLRSKTDERKYLVIDTLTGRTRFIPSGKKEDKNETRLLLAYDPAHASRRKAYLMPERPPPHSHLALSAAPSLLAFIPVLASEKGPGLHFVSPMTEEDIPLAAEPVVPGPPVSVPSLARSLLALRLMTQKGHHLAALQEGIRHLPTPDPSALGCAIAHLRPDDASFLAKAYPGLVPECLKPHAAR